MQRLFNIAPWHVRTHRFAPETQRLRESITSLANGYMGVRGNFAEGYTGDSLWGTYLGGVWYPDKTRVGWWKNGYPPYFGKVINALNFMSLPVRLNDQNVDLARDSVTDFDLDLDLKRGLVTRSFVIERPRLRVRLIFEHFLSVAQHHLVVQRVTVVNLGKQAVRVTLTPQLNANVRNEDANYDERFWEVVTQTAQAQSGTIVARTVANSFGTPRFTTAVKMTTTASFPAQAPRQSPGIVAQPYTGTLAPMSSAQVQKRVVVVTSRDYATQSAVMTALATLSAQVTAPSYGTLLVAHTKKWAQRWAQADVVIEGDEATQQGIRFNLFQLLSTYYGDDARLNIGPKGFTGEKYGGATYWDTEAFAVPVYLGIAPRHVTLNLLKYRYQQLPGAFINAKRQGLKGALFPMVTFNGLECHNEWEITFEEIHRNGDVAFAIYQYTRYTGDTEYVHHAGARVLTEISRFWADRVHYSARKQQYMIHGVTGTDEYENNVDNNWNTNLMARWTLSYTLKVLAELDAPVAARLNVTTAEKQHWQAIIDKLDLPYDQRLGIFVQHDGFLDKDLQPASTIPPAQRPLNQHWSWDRILRSPFIKQADVLQGIWNFIDDFTPAQKRANFDFYEPLTVHESSLSPAVHAVLAADLHREDQALALFLRTTRLDLDDYNHDTAAGLHVTAMTGGWLAIVQGFAGMRVRHGHLHYAPFLPGSWRRYAFHQVFRGRVIAVTVDQAGAHFRLISGPALTIDVAGHAQVLTPPTNG